MRNVAGMSVIVTGGGSGIGAATADHFAKRGALVTLAGRRANRVRQVAESIGPAAKWVHADITVADDRSLVVESAINHAGGIDVLVNCAADMYRGPFSTLDEQQLIDIFHNNVVSAMMVSQAALPHLVERKGAIIFFGSVHVTRAFPGASPYAATKGALEALTGVLASELGPLGVRVSCVRPGAVLSELNVRAGLFDMETARRRNDELGPAHVLGRPGTASEIAEAVEYLACAEWTTGSVMVVDGGLGLGTTHA